MIKIEKNSNFPKFFNVFAFGKFVDQVQGQARAVRVAKKLAKENEQDLIINQGKVEEIAWQKQKKPLYYYHDRIRKNWTH